MDVILLQDVEKVGLKGDVVNVARGYARNFLLPRRLAEPATPGRLAELERHQQLRARHEAQTVEQAQETAQALEQAELRFDMKAGPTGSLFGSVTATDIAEELWSGKRIRVDRKKIDLQDPIKRIGRYAVPIELFTDVTAEVRVLVVPEGGELPPEEPEPELTEAPAAEESASEPEALEAEAVEPEALEPEPSPEAVSEPEPEPQPAE
jgi:large subunit ribosomal protein L9